ncbi:AraC family transcriptional regulator [Pendulispora rubella]|uniref:AraC family transcriptional regulator n=1 Tax=Pendulispora rubella TaxID=2741070 RepID=A0ABZ2L359_9BACT
MPFPVTSAIAMLEGFGMLGLDAGTIRAHAGIALRDLADTTAHLSDEKFARMWGHAFELTGRDSLSIEVAQRLPLGSFGLFDYLVASAASIGEALDALARYFDLVGEGMLLEIDRSRRGRVWVRVHNARIFEGLEVSDEFTLAAILLRLQTLAVEPIPTIQVNLVRRSVTDRGHWEKLWGTKVRFRSPSSSLCLADTACAIPLRTADPRLQRVLRRTVHEARALPPSLLLVARTTLRNLLRGSTLSEAQLARSLSMSVRSLQRRLRDVGTSYRLLLDEVRHEEAIRMLESTPTPLAQVALALGFREQASFTRAFRRWTGHSPRAWIHDNPRRYDR